MYKKRKKKNKRKQQDSISRKKKQLDMILSKITLKIKQNVELI